MEQQKRTQTLDNKVRNRVYPTKPLDSNYSLKNKNKGAVIEK
jgi:hypothetical protein